MTTVKKTTTTITTTTPAPKPMAAPKKVAKVTAPKAVIKPVAPKATPKAPAPRSRRPAAIQPAATTTGQNNVLMIALLVLIVLLLAFVAWKSMRPAAAPLPPVVGNPAPAAPQSPLSSSYPLAGQKYESPQGSSYNAIWTADGRLWQPQLPTGAQRIAHTVAFTIEEGSYAFDGVECQLFVDSTRNGAGASNPVTVEYGNDLRFSVSTTDHGQAWALVQCRGNFSSGFQIRSLGSLLP